MSRDSQVSAFTGRGRAARGGLTPWLFLAPYLLVFLAFFLLPALWSALLSVTDWKIVGTPHFVGGKNYARLFNDPLFHTALKNTVVYTAVIVPVMALVGLGLALLLNQPLRGRVVARTAVFASYVVMVSVVGITWRWMLDPTGAGIVNYYLALSLVNVIVAKDQEAEKGKSCDGARLVETLEAEADSALGGSESYIKSPNGAAQEKTWTQLRGYISGLKPRTASMIKVYCK